MKMKTMIISAIALFFTVSASAQYADLSAADAAALNDAAGRNVARYNPTHADLGVGLGLGLEGQDPVSYYSEQGPVEGSESITVKHEGVLYQFASEANKETFLANPNKYEPTYGGWCAFAMSSGNGSAVPINVKAYNFDLDEDGNRVRLNFFVNSGALAAYVGIRRRNLDDIDPNHSEDPSNISLHVISEIENGNKRFLDRSEAGQGKADTNWAKSAHGSEQPRFSNGIN